MYNFRIKRYIQDIPIDTEAFLGADIGGTNSNFGFFRLHAGKPQLLFSLHAKSQQIIHFPDVVNEVLTYANTQYQMSVSRACFAVAGVLSADNNYCKPTNLDLVIDAQDILKHTSLKQAHLINDFQVIAYGLDLIDPHDIILVQPGITQPQASSAPLYKTLGFSGRANKVILGAGTGLGKTILTWDSNGNRYVSHASEGGHADFAAQNQLEFDLVMHIKQQEHCSNVSWEDLLSGNGIKRLYDFFRHRNHAATASPTLVRDGLHPDEIFNLRNSDEHSKNTFDLYTHFYARCAKNFALDGLALAGVYIAGGIAAKNIPLFRQECFLHEFVSCDKQKILLEQIPVYVIADYNVSLFGAAQYLISCENPVFA